MQTDARTGLGVLRGRILRSHDRPLVSFLGVPYAAPPVADARFAPPRPAEAWTGVRDALAFGAAPPQVGGPLLDLLGTSVTTACDEDCLTLNVWTPGVDDARRPVMVWIHGGAFISGASSGAIYDGARLAARGDVVVVTFNYRVGALGYLHLAPGHAEGGPACTNLGLQDQIAALRFVRDHIAAFGGDPDRVTLFGESAGAGSLCALLAAPSARGLFHAAIPQSGAPDGFLLPEEAEARTRRLLDTLGVSRSALRDVAVDALISAQQKCATERVWKTGMFFVPVIDGEILPERPMAAVRDGRAARVPLMIGTTRDELQLFKFGTTTPELDDETVVAVLAESLPGAGADGRPLAAGIVDVYRRVRGERGESLAGIDLIYAVQTDLSMRGPAIRLAEHHGRHQPLTFMYLFDWESPAEHGALGSCHALDVPFPFGALDVPGIATLTGSGEGPERLAEDMMDAWIAFAQTGRPNSPRLGAFAEYTTDTRITMVFGAKSGPVSAPREAERLALAGVVAAQTP